MINKFAQMIFQFTVLRNNNNDNHCFLVCEEVHKVREVVHGEVQEVVRTVVHTAVHKGVLVAVHMGVRKNYQNLLDF